MTQRILEILNEYRARAIGDGDAEVMPDLQIKDLYAVRVGADEDYLVHADSGFVEEVRFDSWPPR